MTNDSQESEIKNETLNHEAKNESQSAVAKTEMEKKFVDVLKDAGLIIAGLTALFYVFGSAAYTKIYIEDGIPKDFQPDQPIEQILLVGGLLYFLSLSSSIIIAFPIYLLVLKCRPRKSAEMFMRILRRMYDLGFPVIVALAIMPFGSMGLTQDFILKFYPRALPQVKSIRFPPDRKATTTYEGFFYIGKKGTNYIFSDKVGKGAVIYIVNEDEVKELVIVGLEVKTPPAPPTSTATPLPQQSQTPSPSVSPDQ